MCTLFKLSTLSTLSLHNAPDLPNTYKLSTPNLPLIYTINPIYKHYVSPIYLLSTISTHYLSPIYPGSTKLCAGDGTRDTCNGDSGGALLSSQLGGSWAVVGVTSFGVDCARRVWTELKTKIRKDFTITEVVPSRAFFIKNPC